MTFEYICFAITNCCNQSCEFCYRLDSDNKFINERDFIACLEKVKALGCKMINISGGEPLLHKDWRSFVRIAHDMGFIVVLSTNGMLLDLDDQALKYVEEIAIPLDGSNKEVDSKYRGENHYDVVVNLINQYRESDYHFKLKVGTVATRENYDDLAGIIPIIENANIFWRVFFCKSKGKYNHIDESKQLTSSEYQKKIEELNAIMPSSIFFMKECCQEDGIGTKETTLISAEGALYISNDYSDDFVGDLRVMSSDEIRGFVLNKGYTIRKHPFYYDDVI